MLADEGLVTAADQDGKRTFAITDTGRAQAEEQIATKGLPWDAMDRSGVEQGGLRAAVRDLHMAAKQVGVTGSTDVVERATEIVTGARRSCTGCSPNREPERPHAHRRDDSGRRQRPTR